VGRVQVRADAAHDFEDYMYIGVMHGVYPAPTMVGERVQKRPILGPQVFWSGAAFGFTTTW
jgi:hypothetical protein